MLKLALRELQLACMSLLSMIYCHLSQVLTATLATAQLPNDAGVRELALRALQQLVAHRPEYLNVKLLTGAVAGALMGCADQAPEVGAWMCSRKLSL